jgi:hypothetical protein
MDEYSLESWKETADRLSEAELHAVLTEGEPEAWRVMAALGFLALKRDEIGLHQINALTSAGMDVLSLSMFDVTLAHQPAPSDELLDLYDDDE